MGRIAGVTVDETRQRLLTTAADVFGRLGYDGASIAQITVESGLSSGAIYAHFASKAELFVATVRSHAEAEFERLLGGDGDVATFLRARGADLDVRATIDRPLLLEAMVAAKRDPDVADVLRTSITARERQLVNVFRMAQDVGTVDPTLSAAATIRFSLVVALGSAVVGALDLPAVEHEAWSALISRLVDNIVGGEGGTP